MRLKEKIQEDFKRALKEKKELEVLTLRMLKAAIFNKEKEKRYRLSREKPGIIIEELKKESPLAKELERESALSDEEVIEVIFSEIKKRKEAILEFEKGQREDLIKKERAEIEILQKYLPQPLSEKEIKKLAKETIEMLGAKEIKDTGRVMAELMKKIKGKADGALVVKIVRELLSSSK